MKSNKPHKIIVLCPDCRHSTGWLPVVYLAELIAKTLEAELIFTTIDNSRKLEHWFNLFYSKTNPLKVIALCPQANSLNQLSHLFEMRIRPHHSVAWVIDSFTWEHIPKMLNLYLPYDRIYVTHLRDIDVWEKKTRLPVSLLPWGADVLDLGSERESRQYDLLRVGRQPSDWDDDERNFSECNILNLNFHPRPPRFATTLEHQKGLANLYGTTKYCIAFSNLIDNSNYTHKKFDYFTARWSEALAGGTVVAGIPPQEEGFRELLWPGALLELENTKLADGLNSIYKEVKNWKPSIAQNNYYHALERLDWRWRIQQIAKDMEIYSDTLNKEIQRLETLIELKRTQFEKE